MIGKIIGKVDEINQNYVLLNPGQQVFYKVYLPAISLKQVAIGQTHTFYIYFHVRENEISLYGFPDKKLQQVFYILLNIPTIGPKSALNIVGFAPLEKLIEAVNKQNVQYFSQIPKVGKKTAQKILLDLSSKFSVEFKPQLDNLTEEDKLVVEALQSLGFKKNESVIAAKKTSAGASLEKRITEAIKNLNHHGNQ
jgi:holliday junction DNA helicase RuvA